MTLGEYCSNLVSGVLTM